jgi:Predicted ATPase
MAKTGGGYLTAVELKRQKVDFGRYPYSLPVIRLLDKLELHPKVTFFIGENGSGKSTLLEAIAVACGFNPEGGSKNFNFSTNATHSELYNQLRLIRSVVRPRDGYFLRAESFYNVASQIDELDRTAGGPRVIDAYGGESLHHQSHGESFFALFVNRLRGSGLYLLDEPEAALSPTRQLAFLSRLHELVTLDAQFIIATHSPIIMAYPDSIIYEFGKDGIRQIEYEKTEQYSVYNSFFTDHKRFFHEIYKETEKGNAQ